METTSEEKKSGSKIKPLHVGIIAVLVIIVVAGAYFAVNASAQVVAVGDTINVSYVGTFTNGTVFGVNAVGQTLQFTVGSNQLIPGFDQGVIGMRLDQQKTITVPANF